MNGITSERKTYDDLAIDQLGNQYRIENGYLGYRGTLEEYTKDQRAATTVCTLDDQCGDVLREAVNVPNGGYIQILVNGTPLHALSGGVLAHTQALDNTHDIHFRRTVFSVAGGGMILVRARRFASLPLPHLLCIEYTVQASREGEIVIRSGIDGDVWEINGPHLDNFNTFYQAGLLSLTAQTHTSRIPIAVSEKTLLTGGKTTCVQEERRILQEIALPVNEYQPVILTKFVTIYTGRDSDDPLVEGNMLCCRAAQIGFEALYQDHCSMWDKRWRGQ
jgi:nigerose phosphorylase